MKEEKILKAKVKVKRNFKVSLIIIGSLIIILLGLTYFFYFKSGNPKDTYIKILDTFSSGFNKALDNVSNTPKQIDYNFSFNAETNDTEIKQVTDLLNKMKLNLSLQTDYVSKKINLGLGVNYNNNNLLNADVVMNETSIYANLGSLYEKSIKLPIENIESIWNAYKTDAYKVVVNNFIDILKSNLKDEYFSEKTETINIYGDSVKAEKHIMSLTGRQVHDISIGIMNDIKENSELISAIVSISGMTELEFKEYIETCIENIILDEDLVVLVEVFLDAKDILRINIKDGVDTITLNKEKEKEPLYVIKYNDINIGEIYLSEEALKLNINVDGSELIFETLLDKNEEKYEVKVSLTSEDNTIAYELKDTLGKGNGSIKIYLVDDSINLDIDFDYEIKDIKSIDNINVSNYIELENMTDEDYNTIMTHLYQNESFVDLLQSFMLLDSTMY